EKDRLTPVLELVSKIGLGVHWWKPRTLVRGAGSLEPAETAASSTFGALAPVFVLPPWEHGGIFETSSKRSRQAKTAQIPPLPAFFLMTDSCGWRQHRLKSLPKRGANLEEIGAKNYTQYLSNL